MKIAVLLTKKWNYNNNRVCVLQLRALSTGNLYVIGVLRNHAIDVFHSREMKK